MRKLYFTILFSFLVTCLYSQYNLVPNYSFEDSVKCPKFLNNSLPKPWYIPSNFSNGAFLHACSLDTFAGVPINYLGSKSYQYARTGLGYSVPMFLGSNFRIYIQVKLKDSLRKGHCYECTFYASLTNVSTRASNNISMLLTKTKIYSDTLGNPTGLAAIPGNPQVFNYGNPIITDTMNWVKVSSIYVATGEENFITIGNFKTDAQTQTVSVNTTGTNNVYYYIDDVSITPLDSIPLKADAGRDSSINPGDSVFIGSLTNGLTNVKWFNAAGNVIETVKPGFYVKPVASTFYVMEQTVCGQYSRDTVNITIKDTTTIPGTNGNNLFVVYPNPARNMVNIKGDNIKTVELFDCLGRRLAIKNESTNLVSMPLFGLSSSMYFLKITESNNNVTIKKFFKYP